MPNSKKLMPKNDHAIIDQALTLLQGELKELAAESINESVAKAVAEFTGDEYAQVQSAVLLTPDEKNKITNLLLVIFRRDVTIQYGVNPKLLGGFKISVGDWKLDASLATKIAELTNYLGGTVS